MSAHEAENGAIEPEPLRHGGDHQGRPQCGVEPGDANWSEIVVDDAAKVTCVECQTFYYCANCDGLLPDPGDGRDLCTACILAGA